MRIIVGLVVMLLAYGGIVGYIERPHSVVVPIERIPIVAAAPDGASEPLVRVATRSCSASQCTFGLLPLGPNTSDTDSCSEAHIVHCTAVLDLENGMRIEGTIVWNLDNTAAAFVLKNPRRLWVKEGTLAIVVSGEMA